MRLSHRILIASVVAAALFPAGAAWAQGRRGGGNPHPPKQSVHPPAGRPGRLQNPGRQGGAVHRQVEEFMRMSPAEREKEIAKLPPERQERVRERLQQFDQMPPAQKERLLQQWERLSQLSPERQQEVRQSMRSFQEQPPERRQAMRRQLAQVRAMNPEERKTYFNSPEFRSQFSPEEQGIMRNMTEILPPE